MLLPVSVRFASAALLCLVVTSTTAVVPVAHKAAQTRLLSSAPEDGTDGSGGLSGGSGACGTDGSPCTDPLVTALPSTGGGDAPVVAPPPDAPVRAPEAAPCTAHPAPPGCDDPALLPPAAQLVAPAGDHAEGRAPRPGVTRPGVTSTVGLTVAAAEWRSDRLLEMGVRTPAVTEPARFRVLLPTGYTAQPGRRYPVLYLLPGRDADFRYWSDTTDIARLIGDIPLIVIMPDAAGPSRLHFTRLVPWVDANFHTRADRAGRALAGPATGGVAAATAPDLFTMAAALPADVDPRDELGRELPRIMAAVTQQP